MVRKKGGAACSIVLRSRRGVSLTRVFVRNVQFEMIVSAFFSAHFPVGRECIFVDVFGRSASYRNKAVPIAFLTYRTRFSTPENTISASRGFTKKKNHHVHRSLRYEKPNILSTPDYNICLINRVEPLSVISSFFLCIPSASYCRET